MVFLKITLSYGEKRLQGEKGERRETIQEAISVHQEKDAIGFNQGSSSEGGRKGLGYGESPMVK